MFLATTALAVSAAPGLAAPVTGKIPLPRPRPAITAAPKATTAAKVSPANPARTQAPVPNQRPAVQADGASAFAAVTRPGSLRGALGSKFRPASVPFAAAATATTSATDKAAVKRMLELVRKSKDAEADAVKNTIEDPLARKLAEYLFLRSESTSPRFDRFAAFIAANPTWPHIPLLRRRAENALWDDNRDDNTVRNFFATQQPTTAKGRFILARAMLAQGNRAGAELLVREAWQQNELSSDVENRALDMFKDFITTTDHRVRMNVRLFAGDNEGGLRAATRLGGNDLAIARARIAIAKKSGDPRALLDAVPAAARRDAGYIFARAQWMRKKDMIAEAAQLMLTGPSDPTVAYDADQWWIERRLLLRKVLDSGDTQTAYRLARDAAPPTRGNYRADFHFTAGWIALRFLHDPAKALSHFSQIAGSSNNPHALSRAGYWQGRAAEAMNRRAEANAFYQTAAPHSATYYGQLARAKLGLPDVGVVPAPVMTPEERAALGQLEIVRAVDILYAIDERDLIASIMAELGERATDINGIAALGELAARYGDGRAMVHLGKGAHGRGLPLDYYAFPTVGLPDYTRIAPAIEPAVAYSIARQESHFNQKVVSHANAMGLMQVTPAAGQYIAKKFKASYDRGRLLSDPVYNMQMGAAELGDLIEYYRGSYIMTFAGYNAGRTRVRQWVEAHGDPRDPKVDPVDWVELIPIAETRNYVQRIMENMQVYRARFGGSNKLVIEADMRRGAEAN